MNKVMSEKAEPSPEKPLLKRYTGSFLTAQEAADILLVDPNTIRRWVEDGTLEGVKLGSGKRKLIRVRGRAIDKIVDEMNDRQQGSGT